VCLCVLLGMFESSCHVLMGAGFLFAVGGANSVLSIGFLDKNSHVISNGEKTVSR
jgi:hypothetical protein